MKKITLSLILIIFIIGLFATDSLNNYAKTLKNSEDINLKEVYNGISDAALLKWHDDSSMLLYEINKQCEAYFLVFTTLPDGEIQILISAIKKWSQDGYELSNIENLQNGKVYKIRADWTIVKYECDKQLKAKTALK